jgi:hypothetical protein|nr:MAG TPA: hypothetical protein [Bacteriophage sp.]DAR73969.1 MAG TPA: hypothetical protein [Caudoviricetes sp.]DAT49195.1 MAG TPA: hypothetical protein [Caudoviricetes sp.]
MAKKNTKAENDVTEKEQTTEYEVVATFYDKHTNEEHATGKRLFLTEERVNEILDVQSRLGYNLIEKVEDGE